MAEQSEHQRRPFRDFLADRRGNVAMIFGLSLTPVLFLAGAAVDYSGASDLHTLLQKSTDGTNLQLCQMANTTTNDKLNTAAQRSMTGFMGKRPYKIVSLAVTSNPRKITLATSALYDTDVVRAFGSQYAQVLVTADAQCENPQQTFEIALVLDNTGSMASSSGGSSKMDALKAAATNFISFVYSTPKLSQAKISIVPFAAGVAVNPTTYRSASWIDQAGAATYHWNFLQNATEVASLKAKGIKNRLDLFSKLKTTYASWDWAGCLESQPYPYNVRDGSPTSSDVNSYYVPMFAPDESGDGGVIYHQDPTNGYNYVASVNSYMNDDNSSSGCTTTNSTTDAQRTGRSCKYIPVSNGKTSNGSLTTGPNFSCTVRPLTRLTNNQTLLNSEIAAMQPNGNTDTHEGMIWGWRTLSPNSVFADGVPYNTVYNNKIIILMTDGANTWSSNSYSNTLKSYYSAYGYYTNPDGTKPNSRMPPANANISTDSQSRNGIDALTLETCKNSAASPNNVVIYTIGFSVSSDPIDQQGINMLQTCAGSADRAFVANDSSSLTAIFQTIADNIGQLRLTN